MENSCSSLVSFILFSNSRQAEHAVTVMILLSDLSGLCHTADRPPLLLSHSQQSDPSVLFSDWRHLGPLKSHKREKGIRNEKSFWFSFLWSFLIFPFCSSLVLQTWTLTVLRREAEMETEIIRKGRGNRKCRPSFREEAIPDSSLSESECTCETNRRRKWERDQEWDYKNINN